MYPYNHKKGQRIQTNASGVATDRAFLAHIHLDADQAVAKDTDGVAECILGADPQAIVDGITSPTYPRALSVVGNVSGVVGNVKITGTNFAGKEITETIALNQTTLKAGTLAFKEVTKIELPAQVHTPAQQTETIEITNEVTTGGDLPVAITAAALGDASPKTVVIPVTTDLDDVTKVAEAVVDGLNADEVVSEHFVASSEAGVITLTALEPAANDATLAIAFTVGSTGVTVGASTNGDAGVPYDIVSVGWTNILGLPYLLAHNTILAVYLDDTKESNAATVTVDAEDIEKNTIALNTDLDGTAVDVYLIV